MQKKENKMFLNIAYISKVNLASLNGDEGSGGNLTTIKKVTDYKGNEFVYLSGQALRRYLKDTLSQLGAKISEISESGEPTIKDGDKYIDLNKKWNDKTKELVYKSVVDLDLFGFMFPKTFRRWSVVKVAPMLSLLPYKGEVEYLTRKQKSDGKSGNIVQIEIDTLNFMRGNIMVNLEHLGSEVDEFTYEIKPILSKEEKKERLSLLIDAIKFLNGGAKQARNLEDIAPKFVVVTKQKTGNPFLLNVLKVDEEGNIDIDILKEAIKESGVDEYYIGISKGIFNNEDEIRKEFEVMSVNEALDRLK